MLLALTLTLPAAHAPAPRPRAKTPAAAPPPAAATPPPAPAMPRANDHPNRPFVRLTDLRLFMPRGPAMAYYSYWASLEYDLGAWERAGVDVPKRLRDEVTRCRAAWAMLTDAQDECFPVDIRLDRLAKLMELIGPEAYFWGCMPSPNPRSLQDKP